MVKSMHLFLFGKPAWAQAIFTAALLLCAPGLITAKDAAAQIKLTIAVVENAAIPKTGTIIVEEAYRRLGIEIDFDYLPAKRASLESNKGTVDGDAVRHPMVARTNKNLVGVNVPIVRDELIAYSTGQSGSIGKLSDLLTFEVGVSLGDHSIRRLAKHPRLVTYRTPEQGIQMLLKRRLDYVLNWQRNFEKLKKNMKSANQVYPASKSLHTAQGFHFLHKRNKHLIGKLEKILQEMWDEGFVDMVWNSN